MEVPPQHDEARLPPIDPIIREPVPSPSSNNNPMYLEKYPMKRSTFLTMLAAMLVMVMVSIIPGSTFAAQWNNPNCCTYTVDIQGVDPTVCLPFKLQTYWSDGATDNIPYFNNGITVNPIPPGPVPCPPAPAFKGVSIDFGVIVGPGQTIKVVSPNNGCCYWVSAGLDGGGCVYIKIWPC